MIKKKIYKPEGHHCFACGTANPIGLHLDFYRYGESVCSDITLNKNHAGWENIVHGGIISTLLDEVMSWSILYFRREVFFTRKMEVKYIRPVLIDTPLTVRGFIVDETDPKRLKARAEIHDSQENLLSRSNGEFIILKKDEMTSVSDELIRNMFTFLDGMFRQEA